MKQNQDTHKKLLARVAEAEAALAKARYDLGIFEYQSQLSAVIQEAARNLVPTMMQSKPAKRGPGRPKAQAVPVKTKAKKEVAAAPKKMGRPKKVVESLPVVKKATTKPVEAPKKPGRPKKVAPVVETTPKKPGRPKKVVQTVEVAPKKMGRPKKVVPVVEATPKKMGRPKKVAPVVEATPKKMGRPKKVTPVVEATPKKLGRPKKVTPVVEATPKKLGRPKKVVPVVEAAPKKVAGPKVEVAPQPAKKPGRPKKVVEAPTTLASTAAKVKGSRPPLRKAMVTVMGAEEMNADRIVAALTERNWMPPTAKPKEYVAVLLSKHTPSVFERMPKKGWYRVKPEFREVAPVKKVPQVSDKDLQAEWGLASSNVVADPFA